MTSPDSIAHQVGSRIREIRDARGWSRPQLADTLGITRSAVGHWERGHRLPRLDVLARVANCFGVDLASLLPDPAVRETPAAPTPGPWRRGRHWGRTIVTTGDPHWPDGRLIGVMDTPEDAALVVEAVTWFDPCRDTGWVCEEHGLHPITGSARCAEHIAAKPCPRCHHSGLSHPAAVVVAELVADR